MKLKGCLTALGLFGVVIIGISFFLPNKMDIDVVKSLNSSPEQIFTQINNVKNWEHWSPWHKMDPRMELVYSDYTIGTDAYYSWKSRKKAVGSGTMQITESIPYEKVSTMLQMGGDVSHSNFYIEASPAGGSIVTWDFNSDYKAKMPWSKFKNSFYRKMLKKSYNKGLTALDSYIIQHPNEHLEQAAGNAKIEVREVPDVQAVVVHLDGLISDMMTRGAEIFSDAINQNLARIEAEGLTQSGPSFTIPFEWDQEKGTFKMDIAIPVESGGETIVAGKMAVISYYGERSGTGVAHEQLGKYMAAKGLVTRGAPWEVYVTDISQEPNPEKWLTEIMYPVE